jgi:hypothetical protein
MPEPQAASQLHALLGAVQVCTASAAAAAAGPAAAPAIAAAAAAAGPRGGHPPLYTSCKLRDCIMAAARPSSARSICSHMLGRWVGRT